MRKQLYSIWYDFLLVIKKPQVLKRGGNPFVWAFHRAIAEWKFESANVDEMEFVSSLTGCPVQQCRSLLCELRSQVPTPLLYCIVRMLQPESVVETGVAAGRSSASILLAMEENKKGMLHSIDLPTKAVLEDGHIYAVPGEVGCGVPQRLRHRWNLIPGDSRDELSPLLSRLSEIDIFIHDSLHTEKHMTWEYQLAWPFLRPGGILLSHDISVAFSQFARKEGRSLTCCGRPDAKYGGIVR